MQFTDRFRVIVLKSYMKKRRDRNRGKSAALMAVTTHREEIVRRCGEDRRLEVEITYAYVIIFPLH